MTCSGRERALRLQRAEQARRLGAYTGAMYASYGNRRWLVGLLTLTIHNGEDRYVPFATVEEALNTMVLLGGGPI